MIGRRLSSCDDIFLIKVKITKLVLTIHPDCPGVYQDRARNDLSKTFP